MSDPVVIVVPMLPPRECSPNYHGYWRYRAEAAREWRQCAFLVAMAFTSSVGESAGPVFMDIEVSWSGDRRRMDSDNLIAACKPARDGIADALFGGDDSRIRVGTVTQSRGLGATRFTLRQE